MIPLGLRYVPIPTMSAEGGPPSLPTLGESLVQS